MLLEDFNMNSPDLQPWDPRIKEIVMLDFPSHTHGGYLDAQQFIVYLHCKRKIGWAVTNDVLMQCPPIQVFQMLRSGVEQYIDEEYKKLQEMAGGSVDIYGKPILTVSTEFFPIWEDSNLQAISSGLKIAQLTDEEQYQAWCKQAENFKGATTPGVPTDGIWYPNGGIAEGFITEPPTATGSIVQRNLKKLFPGLVELVTCPVCKNKNAIIEPQQIQLASAIIHLNDTHSWSREAVADWLESLDVDIAMKEENV
jgi:hypothetical protein